MVNLFPSLVIVGPPHSGKSVLSFLLSQKLREANVAHYLLRAAPDGEGNWFHEGNGDRVYLLRQKEKGFFDARFVSRIINIINARSLPLLVDVGGSPRGEQFDILKACTHSIILYKNDKDLQLWRRYCDDANLIPVSELRSMCSGKEKIEHIQPLLRASITGLERHKPKAGVSFGAVLERISGIFFYRAEDLQRTHISNAPYPVLIESEFAKRVGLGREKTIWNADDLVRLKDILPESSSLALYGCGPVWLASFFSAQNSPAPFSVFDIRYGWVDVSKIEIKGKASLNYEKSYKADADWMELSLSANEILPQDVSLPFWSGSQGLVLSGKLPRWLYAALAAHYAPKRAWIGVYEPRNNKVIVVFSRVSSPSVGDVKNC